MIEEQGLVVAVDGEFAWVETQRKTACESCSVSKGCGTAAVSKVFDNRFTRVKALNQNNAKVGERVVIGLHDQALVRGSLAVYAMPLLAMLLAAVAAETIPSMIGFSNNELFTIVAALSGLGLGFVGVRYFSHHISKDDRYQPVIIRHCDITSTVEVG